MKGECKVDSIYITRSEEMPMRLKGVVTMTAEGDYIIAINGRLREELQLEALAHELEHICQGDLAKRHIVPARIIEALRRK